MPPPVRRAGPEDVQRLASLLRDFQEEFEEPCPEPAVLERRYRELIAAGEMLVLLVGEPAVGFAQLRFRPWVYSEGGCAYLEELYVAPAERGEGAGRALLEAAMDAAREHGVDHIELNTSETDRAARSLYESVGFTNREGNAEGPVMLYYERELRP
jgi:ribosomal protein S18 acetylase RimI-like enzyme